MFRQRIHRMMIALCLGLCLLLSGCPQESGGSATESPETSESAPATPTLGPIETLEAFIEEQNIDRDAPSWKTRLPKPPLARFPAGKTYYWLLETNVGEMKIKFMAHEAPMHVSSTIYLTKLGFYDGVGFHRVIQGFMAQGGDPLGNGRGGPGYQYSGEFTPDLRHNKRGQLSMANAGPGTDGSQFFITFKPTRHLNDKHTLFGELVDGMETLDKIESLGSARGATREPLLIQKASILVE